MPVELKGQKFLAQMRAAAVALHLNRRLWPFTALNFVDWGRRLQQRLPPSRSTLCLGGAELLVASQSPKSKSHLALAAPALSGELLQRDLPTSEV